MGPALGATSKETFNRAARLASEVKSVLAEVESTSDMIGESSLKKSCKDYVEEARRLLEEINIEENRDEGMIEKLNRVHGRLIMCLGYNVKYN